MKKIIERMNRPLVAEAHSPLEPLLSAKLADFNEACDELKEQARTMMPHFRRRAIKRRNAAARQ